MVLTDKPSEVYDKYWIRVRNEVNPYLGSNEFVGKWMEFVYLKNVDEVWAKIEDATRMGRLGIAAKVATSRPNPNQIRDDLRLVCVYTCDWRVREDVLRVRKALRDCGIVRKISYKTDADTYAGKYRQFGDKGIAKYYSDGTEAVLEEHVSREERGKQAQKMRAWMLEHPSRVDEVKKRYGL